ncbi:MAG: hypothetical protein OXE98_04955 [Hyphomicrobiales bacterium]|nr:hypothetical protein [Hyphomicrobiales bacterium]
MKKTPCIIDGVHYESISAAARALGVDFMMLRTRLRSSNFPDYTSKYHAKVKRKTVSIPCVIRGVEYPSISDATRKLKTQHEKIRSRLSSSNFPDYVAADIPKKPHEPPKPIKYRYTVNGKKYRSLQEIGDMEGLTKERIRQKMNSSKYPGYRRL